MSNTPSHIVHFEAHTPDDGDEFLFALVEAGVLSKEDYPALFPRGDAFLVYGKPELDKVREIIERFEDVYLLHVRDYVSTPVVLPQPPPLIEVIDLSDLSLEKELEQGLALSLPEQAARTYDESLRFSRIKTEAVKRGLWSESGIRCQTCREFIEFDVERDLWVESRQIPMPDECHKAISYRHRPEGT